MERSKNYAFLPRHTGNVTSLLEGLRTQADGKKGQYRQWFKQCMVADPEADGEERDVTWRVRRAIFEQNNRGPVWASQIKTRLAKDVYEEKIIDLEDAEYFERYLLEFHPEGVIRKTRFSYPPDLLELIAADCSKKTRNGLPKLSGLKQFDFDIVDDPHTPLLLDAKKRVVQLENGLIVPQSLTRKQVAEGYKLINGVLFRDEEEFEDQASMEACDISAIRAIVREYFREHGIDLHATKDGQRSGARRNFARYANTANASPLDYYYGKDATPAERDSLILRSVGLGHLIKPEPSELQVAA